MCGLVLCHLLYVRPHIDQKVWDQILSQFRHLPTDFEFSTQVWSVSIRSRRRDETRQGKTRPNKARPDQTRQDTTRTPRQTKQIKTKQSATQPNPTQRNTIQHSTAQHNPTQRNITQHNTTQRNTPHRGAQIFFFGKLTPFFFSSHKPNTTSMLLFIHRSRSHQILSCGLFLPDSNQYDDMLNRFST
jgi:hypothetical protein